MFEVPAGGRRFKALQLLVKQKKMSKTAPIPCIVKTDGLAEEDSLAENLMREALHPLDQFRAFQALADAGQGLEAIAATFGVTAQCRAHSRLSCRGYSAQRGADEPAIFGVAAG